MANIPILSKQLQANIEAILQPTGTYSSVGGVKSNILITEVPKANSYCIDIIFHNSVKEGLEYEGKEGFEFTPQRINSFRIEQNFEESYLNHYEVNVMLTIDQYQLLYYNYKDLRCTLIIYAANASDDTVYGKNTLGEPVLFIRGAYCMFKDRIDLLKKNPRSTIIPDKNQDVPTHHDQFLDNILFQLIPEEDYLFHLYRCTTIFSNSTVRDAIWGITQEAKCIDAIMLIDPNNEKKYKNLVIPPILSIPEALSFLQDHYGVYNKGINYYYQGKTLYVYPKYEMNPVLPKDKSEQNEWNKEVKVLESRSISVTSSVGGKLTLDMLGDGGMVHVYIAGDNSYTGLQCYHGYENQTIHIVSNEEPYFNDLADKGIENVGYSFIIHNSDRDIDECRTVIKADNAVNAANGLWPVDIHKTPNNLYIAADKQNEQLGLTSTKANVKYKDSKSNQFTIRTQLSSYRRSIATFKWNAAVPFTFRPGYRILVHYDGEDETNRDLSSTTSDNAMYKTKPGVVNAVVYEFTIEKIGPQIYYFCQASVAASLDVDTTQHKETII